MPAALLIAPMIAGFAAGTNGATVRVPGFLFAAAQGVVGCLIAASITGGDLLVVHVRTGRCS